jgi:predicted transcriptional regulator
MVRRSKLEVNLDILMYKTDLSQSVLEQHLDFLIPQNLVEEQNLGKDETFYVITERGLRVLKVVVPIIEEARKIPALLH